MTGQALHCDQGRDWRRWLGMAALWGLATWVIEVAVLPMPAFGVERVSHWVAIWLLQLPQWFGGGMGMALCMIWAERRFGWLGMAVVAVLFALSWAMVQTFWITPSACKLAPSPSVTAHYPSMREPCFESVSLEFGLYPVWELLVIAATFTPIYILSARAERIRSALARAEIARRLSEEAAERSRLQALQHYVDPRFLLSAIGVIQDRYRSDPGSADRLMDRLVAYLRSLMPSLRGAVSTLDVELSVLRAYALLCDEVQSAAGAWRIEVGNDVPCDVDFPAQMLMPLIEELRAMGELRPAWAVSAHSVPGSLRIQLSVCCDTSEADCQALEWRIKLMLGSSADSAGKDVVVASRDGETSILIQMREARRPQAATV